MYIKQITYILYTREKEKKRKGATRNIDDEKAPERG